MVRICTYTIPPKMMIFLNYYLLLVIKNMNTFYIKWEPPAMVMKQQAFSLYHLIPSESECPHPGLFSTTRFFKISGYHILIWMCTFDILDPYVSRTFKYTIHILYSSNLYHQIPPEDGYSHPGLFSPIKFPQILVCQHSGFDTYNCWWFSE